MSAFHLPRNFALPICAVALCLASVAAAQQPAPPVVLHAARLLQVDTGTLLQPGEVLVEGERIRAVGAPSIIRRAPRSSTSATPRCCPA